MIGQWVCVWGKWDQPLIVRDARVEGRRLMVLLDGYGWVPGSETVAAMTPVAA